jgi:hypothetical protein
MGAVGSELPTKPPEKTHAFSTGGAESGAPGHITGFADAVAAVMRLPLSDSEKAEAVRRLLRR